MELYNNPQEIVFTTPLPDIAHFLPDKSAAILDLGCGYGRVLKHCYDLGYANLTGVDTSEELIERAKKNCPIAKYINGDITKINELENYDFIMICGVIEYIIDKKDRFNLLSIIKKHLNKNGKVLLEAFIIDEREELYAQSEKLGYEFGVIQLSNGMDLRHSTVKEIDTLFESENFEKIVGKEEIYKTWVGADALGYSSVWVDKRGD